tara:strand:+ start:106 stop:336 length:231 start_codon:yes stop_codon:yes gene_type:complete
MTKQMNISTPYLPVEIWDLIYEIRYEIEKNEHKQLFKSPLNIITSYSDLIGVGGDNIRLNGFVREIIRYDTWFFKY